MWRRNWWHWLAASLHTGRDVAPGHVDLQALGVGVAAGAAVLHARIVACAVTRKLRTCGLTIGKTLTRFGAHLVWFRRAVLELFRLDPARKVCHRVYVVRSSICPRCNAPVRRRAFPT